jgi:glycosyltransferase involved in cell wall biosynthesis
VSAYVISCVVPVYNGERFLAEGLDSVLAQTRPPDEVIVVDDGSTDGTAEVAARYAGRVTYLRQNNAGSPAARNRGVASSRGDLIAFLDADDLWHPEKLAKQAARFEARPELGLCVTLVRNFWIPELRHEEERLRGHPFTGDLPGMAPQCLLARRSVFDIVGPLDESLRLGDDTDWFLRAADKGIVLEMLKEVLTYRRIHHSNLTRQVTVLREAMVDVVRESLRRRRQAPPVR